MVGVTKGAFAMDALLTDWHGQKWVDLPGRLHCRREYGRLVLEGTFDPGS